MCNLKKYTAIELKNLPGGEKNDLITFLEASMKRGLGKTISDLETNKCQGPSLFRVCEVLVPVLILFLFLLALPASSDSPLCVVYVFSSSCASCALCLYLLSFVIACPALIVSNWAPLMPVSPPVISPFCYYSSVFYFVKMSVYSPCV